MEYLRLLHYYLFFFVVATQTLFTTTIMAMALTEAKASSSSMQQPRFRTWPISATKVIESQLREMGLKIPAEMIDGTTSTTTAAAALTNDDGSRRPPPLSDALVSVGPAGRGGTGSFVSEDGLILTNWHVAYDAGKVVSPTG